MDSLGVSAAEIDIRPSCGGNYRSVQNTDKPFRSGGHMWLELTFRPSMRTVITETHRYTRDSDGFETLYDLDRDPGEVTNLAVHQRDRAGRAAAVDALVDEMTRADDITRPDPVGVTSTA